MPCGIREQPFSINPTEINDQSLLYSHVVTIYKYTRHVPPPPKLSPIPRTPPQPPVIRRSQPLSCLGREGSVVLRVTPASCRVHLGPCEVWAHEGPLKLGHEHHESASGPGDVLAVTTWLAPFRAMLGVWMPLGQLLASRALAGPEAELVQPQGAGVCCGVSGLLRRR